MNTIRACWKEQVTGGTPQVKLGGLWTHSVHLFGVPLFLLDGFHYGLELRIL